MPPDIQKRSVRVEQRPNLSKVTLTHTFLLITFSWSRLTNEVKPTSLYCSGVIGFVLCSTEGPDVDFKNPINPIEKLDGAMTYIREMKFYNSDVSSLTQL